MKLENILKFLLKFLLLILPFQTIWITQEKFLNKTKWEYGTLGFYGSEILLWICVILFIFWYYKQKKLQVTSYKLQVTKDRVFLFSLLLFIIYCLLSSLWAIYPYVAYQHALHIMEAVILFLMIYVGPLKFRGIAVWFVAGAVIQSILGIWQFFTQTTFSLKWLGLIRHPVWEAGTSIISNPEIGRWLRAYGSFPHPNILGGYLIISLIFTALLIKQNYINNKIISLAQRGPSDTRDSERRERAHPQQAKKIILYIILFSVQTVALFFTFSRSAWLAFAVFITGIFIYGLKNKNKQILSLIYYLLSLIIILTIIFFPLVQTRFSNNTVNELRSTSERVNGYREAWQIFRQNPILGVGAGNYTAAAHNLNPNLAGYEYQPVHNVPLLILTELGILGITLVLFITISFIKLINNEQLTMNNFLKSNYALLITLYALLLLFDHYLFSSYIGLLLSGVFLSSILRLKHT